MAGAAARRAGARERLKTGFLAGLPAQLRELAEMLELDDSMESRESAAHTLTRMTETASSLGLSSISRESRRLATRVLTTAQLQYHPLMRALLARTGASLFAPIAFVGGPKELASIEQQDSQICEPIGLFPSLAELREAYVVDWPQAIVLPATHATEVIELAGQFDCPLYLYGRSRDLDARRLAARVGADGYFADPIALPELLSHVRYVSSRPTTPQTVALLGDPDWAREQAPFLTDAGLVPIHGGNLAATASTLHSLYPQAVVLGPADPIQQSESLTMMRHHIGRSHIALIVVGDDHDLYGAGADDVVATGERVVTRVVSRLERFADMRRDRDELTQVLNRSGALEALERMVARTDRGAEPVSIALVFASGLSEAAQEHGREAANACQRHLAIALERGLRRTDLVGYLGNDVFLGAMVDCKAEHATRRLDKLKTTFENRVHADRRLKGVTLAIGIASTARGNNGLMLRALQALEARRKGAQR